MASTKSGIVGGVYEIGVGVTDLAAATAFWRAWGYVPDGQGKFEATQARGLYGVDSALESVRLTHQSATHGLIRLLKWHTPVGRGLGHALLRSTGSRWSVHRTDDVMNVFNHAETARQQGQDIQLKGPLVNVRSTARGYDQRPFLAPIRASHNFQMTLPEARVVAMQRFGVSMARYGTIATESLLRTTEGCHMGLVITGEDFGIFDFYRDIIGFKAGKKVHVTYEPGYTPSEFFDLTPGEHFTEIDFEDPTSGDTLDTQLPGRLRAFLIHQSRPQPDLRALARPGQLGYSLYTMRLRDLATTRDAIVRFGGCSDLTEIQPDEFGTLAFSFTAPDGYAWAAVQA